MASLPAHLPMRRAALVLLCLYFTAGVFYSALLSTQTRYFDENEYLALSDHLRHGPGYSLDGVRLTASRPPGYAFFVATVQALGGGIVAVRIIQYVLVGATILLASRLGPEKDRDLRLLLITLLVILYPVLFYTAGTLYPQTLGGFLFILALTLLAEGRRGVTRHLGAGLVFSALILTIPTFAPTLLAVLAAAWALRLIRWQEGLLILLGASVLVGTWTARNALVFHRLVPLASNSGVNFLIGNCENTVPSGAIGNVDYTRYQREADSRFAGDTPEQREFDEDRFYREAALRWIENHPGRALGIYLQKSANFFNICNEYAPENRGEISFRKQTLMAVSYLLLLTLLVWRLAGWRRFPLSTQDRLCLAVYFLSAFTLAVFFTRIRFRLPYDYLLITVIAAYLGARWSSWRAAPPEAGGR